MAKSWGYVKWLQWYPEWLGIRPLSRVKIPVRVNANAALQEMQPILFSHGFARNRLQYSALCMELASCGYTLFVLDHNDGSCLISDNKGIVDLSKEKYDYEIRNAQV